MKKVRIAELSILLSATSLLAHMYTLAHRNRLLSHSVSISSNPVNRLNVFFISDIHRRVIPEKLISELRSRPIDAVIVGGDAAEKGVPLDRISHNMKLLSTVGPLFYIFGNNDKEVGRENMLRAVKDADGTVLVDETVPVPGHPRFGLCGMQDRNNGTVDIVKAIESTKGYEHLILAVHNPSLFKKVEGFMEPVLSLAGHTHGGQIRLGPWGLQDPGRYELTGTGARLISNGYGTTKLPLRLGAKPECHVVEICY